MAQEEDQREETRVMTISELPGKPCNIILEISLFLIMMGLTLSGTAISNVILYRTCVHSLHHSADECKGFLSPDRTNDTRHLEEEVQKYVTFITTVKTVLESLGPAILSLFLGVWSDTYGRKPLIVWPIFGTTVTMMLTVVFCSMDSLGPWWFIVTIIPYTVTGGLRILITGVYCHISDVTTTSLAMTGMLMVVYSLLDLGPWWYLLALIPLSISGGFPALFTGVFCYISDVTNTQNSSIRMTLMEASIALGSMVGSLVCGHLLKTVGNVYLLLIVAAIFVLAYCLTNIWLQESLTGALPGGFCSVLDFLLIKEMIRDCFKWRPNNLRTQILLVTFANSLNVFILYGLAGLEYMFTRQKLHWSLKDYNEYSAASVVMSFVGSFVGVVVIQRFCGLNDLLFSVLSFLSSTVEYAIKGFAVESWHMYLGSGVAVFNGLSSPLLRSFITKIVPVEDIAKVFALMCAIEGIFPLISPPIYNGLYNVTLSTFPGAVLLLTSSVNAFSVLLLLFVVFYRLRSYSVPYQPINTSDVD